MALAQKSFSHRENNQLEPKSLATHILYDLLGRQLMFRISFVLLAMVSALALNGCSQCSQQQAEEAPAAMEAAPEAAPVDPAAAPMEGAPADGAAAPMEGAPAEATPAAQ